MTGNNDLNARLPIDYSWSVSGRVGFQKVNLRLSIGTQYAESAQGSQLPHTNRAPGAVVRYFGGDDAGYPGAGRPTAGLATAREPVAVRG
jgi:hypothetical protein